MADTKVTAQDSGSIVDKLLESAYRINEDQEALNERRNGTRDSLRSLRKSGVLTGEQAAEVEDLYPTVERKRKAAEKAAAKAEAGTK